MRDDDSQNKSKICAVLTFDDKIYRGWREPIRIDYLFDDIFLFCIFRTCFYRPREGHSVSRAKGEAAYGCKVNFFISFFHVEYIFFSTSTYDDGSFLYFFLEQLCLSDVLAPSVDRKKNRVFATILYSLLISIDRSFVFIK